MEFQLNVLLNNDGNPSRTEYVVDRQQAIELASQILKHYNKELPNNED